LQSGDGNKGTDSKPKLIGLDASSAAASASAAAEDRMTTIGFAGLGPIEQPELGDPSLAADLAGESNEAVKKDDENQKDKANKVPDDHSKTTTPVKMQRRTILIGFQGKELYIMIEICTPT